MNQNKKRGLLVTKEERQLVLHSEVIKKYPELKSVLTQYEKISKKDLDSEAFDEQLKI